MDSRYTRWPFQSSADSGPETALACSCLWSLGAISTVSWLYASFVGVSRWMAPLMSFTDFIALYGVLLAGAIVFALVFIRPRVERLLVAGRVKVGVASK